MPNRPFSRAMDLPNVLSQWGAKLPPERVHVVTVPHDRAPTGNEPRKTGIESLGEAIWGTHLCALFATKTDLLELCGAYFAAGLGISQGAAVHPTCGMVEGLEHQERVAGFLLEKACFGGVGNEDPIGFHGGCLFCKDVDAR